MSYFLHIAELSRWRIVRVNTLGLKIEIDFLSSLLKVVSRKSEISYSRYLFFRKNFNFNQLSDVKLKVSHVSVREEVTCAYFVLNRVT